MGPHMFIAHTKNVKGQRQELKDHLYRVASLAENYAEALHAQHFVKAAGLLHDIGKYDLAFQQYLLEAEQSPHKKRRGPDHKHAGAVYAALHIAEPAGSLLALIIAGHHGGLSEEANLTLRLRERMILPATQQAIASATIHIPELGGVPTRLLPSFVSTSLQKELFARLAFSTLVDADFLDTEHHFTGRRPERHNTWTLERLWKAYTIAHQAYTQRSNEHQETKMHEHLCATRRDVYEMCLQAATLPPGFFRLTVPTGGGKTLSSLGFALKHALFHQQRRIIYAIPYTSIIEQTSRVFFDLFQDDRAYLEHHSNLVITDPDHPTLSDLWRRLAAENWDAPLILTTTVQLFESLLSCHPSTCRKLHNIAQSVIVLDEVQMLPVGMLSTILDVLQQLVEHYGVTVVLCTATQPDFSLLQRFPHLAHVREIVPAPHRYFTTLQRVEYHISPVDKGWSWEMVAQHVSQEHQALVIVNTRPDALAIYDQLNAMATGNDEHQACLFHLSTRLCGAHRRQVLDEVHLRLCEGRPCHLVATQVVEAGVDIDFPLVLRALCPLDRIVQAAGRANREGALCRDGQPVRGKVLVFQPEQVHLPKGDASYQLGTEVTKALLQDPSVDLHDPQLYQRFFRDYYFFSDLDSQQIEPLRATFCYPEVERRFRLIQTQTVPVIVSYPTYSITTEKHPVQTILSRLRQSSLPSRASMRALQPYMVNIPVYELKKAQQRGDVQEIIPDVWEWLGAYDGELNGKGIVFGDARSVDDYSW